MRGYEVDETVWPRESCLISTFKAYAVCSWSFDSHEEAPDSSLVGGSRVPKDAGLIGNRSMKLQTLSSRVGWQLLSCTPVGHDAGSACEWHTNCQPDSTLPATSLLAGLVLYTG